MLREPATCNAASQSLPGWCRHAVPLPPQASTPQSLPHGPPFARQVPAWNTAAMLDFVFTDDRRAMWDNNNGRDYHTLLRNPASGEPSHDVWLGTSQEGGLGGWGGACGRGGMKGGLKAGGRKAAMCC